MRILSIVGTRPQIIKHYAMSLAYKKFGIEDFVLYTGQHYDYEMSEVFFSELKMKKPDLYLKCSRYYGDRLGRIIDGVPGGFDFGVVYGDCDSTLGGALGIKKLGMPLVHIESGLRSFDNEMIEERNRVMVDGISDIRFCPTLTALKNLGGEGIFSGNLNYDLFLMLRDKAVDTWLGDFTLLTVHRQESIDNLEKVFDIASGFRSVLFVCHPHTRKVMEERGLKPEFNIISPCSYLEMIGLIKNCREVVTDSGGITQEAWMWCKKVTNLRKSTEWVETLSPTDHSIYGFGNAAEKIATFLRKI